MKRIAIQSALLLLVVAISVAGGWWWAQKWKSQVPEAPAVVTQIRESMKLEVLEASLYKKVDFSPERKTEDSAWKEVIAWARESLFRPRGRAIVFATAYLGYDLRRLEVTSIRIQDGKVQLVLPSLQVRIELLPDETEVIDSNLNSKGTSQLLEHARKAFLQQVQNDPLLRARARRSAEQALKVFLFPLGFRDVQVVDALPQAGAG
jgi:hypothetical protein